MLTALLTGLRFRLAIAFTVFASLCLVLPPAVLAFGHGENAAHCLAKADAVDHGMAKAGGAMQHDDHATPASDEPAPAPDRQMTCCGLFCLSAVTTDTGGVIDSGLPAAHEPAGESNHLSHLSDRLDRPPITLLFV